MKLQLKLSHKGMLLVGFLLCVELIFVGTLYGLLIKAEQEALVESHSKEIVGVTNHIFQLLYDAGTAAAEFQQRNGGKEYSDKYHAAANKIPAELSKLKMLVADDSLYSQKVQNVSKKCETLLKIVNHIIGLAEQGQWPEALGLAVKTKPIYDEKKTETLNELRSLMAEQERIIAESPIAQARSRQVVKSILLAGLSVNVVLAIVLALFFVRGITGRLDVVVDNTKKLLKREPLNEPLSGADEIAHLDSSFHAMVKQLKEVEEMKQQFVAMVSHDLRTPLTSVCGFLEMLRHGAYGKLSDQGQQRTALAERNISRLIALINDLLDMEKLESGQLELVPEQISVEPVITRSIDAVRVFAEQHKVSIISESNDLTVYADGNRLIQVLVNLISNAVKFSPPESTITISSVPTGGYVELRVADQGRGIPGQFKDVIFERFRQVKTTDATQKGGTGLGLAICKAIVEQHGGTIGVESEEGKGSMFWLRIPSQEAHFSSKRQEMAAK